MSKVSCDVAINLVCVDCGSILHWFQEDSPYTDIPVLRVQTCKKCLDSKRADSTPESIILEPCKICGSTGFHRADCLLFSYPCAICGARISNMNALDHVHNPLPLYVGKPDDSVTTLNVSKSDWLARTAQQNDSNRNI